MPRSGVCIHRAPSEAADGSSVTSKRRCSQPCMAEVIAAPVPMGPDQKYSARRAPGNTGWSTQSKFTARPSARPTAHSKWGHNARGAE